MNFVTIIYLHKENRGAMYDSFRLVTEYIEP